MGTDCTGNRNVVSLEDCRGLRRRRTRRSERTLQEEEREGRLIRRRSLRWSHASRHCPRSTLASDWRRGIQRLMMTRALTGQDEGEEDAALRSRTRLKDSTLSWHTLTTRLESTHSNKSRHTRTRLFKHSDDTLRRRSLRRHTQTKLLKQKTTHWGDSLSRHTRTRVLKNTNGTLRRRLESTYRDKTAKTHSDDTLLLESRHPDKTHSDDTPVQHSWLDEVEGGHRMTNLRDLPPLSSSMDQQQQRRLPRRQQPPVVHEDDDDAEDFWTSQPVSSECVN